MKKYFAVLMVMTMALALAPLPSSAAGTGNTINCSLCGTPSDDLRCDESTHNWYCVNPSCRYYGTRIASQTHRGGEATCTQKAECTVCGNEYGDPLGHDLKKTDQVDPTCTEPGTEAYWTCRRDGCGKLFSDAEGKHQIAEPVAIQELGHDLVHHGAQDPTCTAVGWDAYDACSRCEYTTYAEVPALGHAYGVVERTITRVRYVCRRCHRHRWAFNPRSENALPGLVLDETGADLNYTAGVVLEKKVRVLTVTPKTGENAVLSLCLTPAQAAAWLKEGVDLVRLELDGATLEIELGELGAGWFPTLTGEPERVLFTLKRGDAGMEVLVEALQGDDRTPAETLTGLTLRLGKAALTVDKNGVYSPGI